MGNTKVRHARLLKPGGVTESVSPQDGRQFTLEELQFLVGGYIEMFPLNTKDYIVFNEDGRKLNLAPNRTASGIFGRPLLGNVLIASKVMIP